jgi:hypothetical protein
MDVGIVNGVGKNRVRKQQHHEKTKTPKDPELEAEISYAKENGYEPPKSLPSDKKLAELVDIDDGPGNYFQPFYLNLYIHYRF